MAIIVYQEFTPVKTEKELLAYFKKVLPVTRTFDGNTDVKVCEENGIIKLISEWDTKAKYAKYRKFRASLGNEIQEVGQMRMMTISTVKKNI